MDEKNVTFYIHLLGLQPPLNTTVWVFLIFLMIYCVTLCGNLLIITAVSYSKTLHHPMYFFLSQLSILDILLATTILPSILHSLLVKDFRISFSCCLTQFYFFSASEASESLLLTTMSYDRYFAICRPLHYVLVMNPRVCRIIVITGLTLSVFIVLIFTLTISKLEFPDPAIIDHFFCEFYPILEISATDTKILKQTEKCVSIIFNITPFAVIIVSYIYITFTIFKMSSVSGRQKLFSTCSSHMTVVCMYYGSVISNYVLPNRVQFRKITKYLSLLYSVITPLMNPIIYSLRNEDLKNSVRIFIGTFIKRRMPSF